MERLKSGDKAPAFELLNANEEKVALADLLNQYRVLVYFYPKAMTPGCTVQAQNLRDAKEELAKHNVISVGISPDAPKRLAKFTERDELNFTLLSDEDHKVADQFGVWGPKKFMGREFDGILRISYIIDEEGNIEQVFGKVKTKTHGEDVLGSL